MLNVKLYAVTICERCWINQDVDCPLASLDRIDDLLRPFKKSFSMILEIIGCHFAFCARWSGPMAAGSSSKAVATGANLSVGTVGVKTPGAFSTPLPHTEATAWHPDCLRAH